MSTRDDPLAVLRQAATAPHPDADLVAACDRLQEILALEGSPYFGRGRRAPKPTLAQCVEYNDLHLFIASRRALTELGRRSKGVTALARLRHYTGAHFDLIRTAVEDLLSEGCEVPPALPPPRQRRRAT
jgi:hypothetical protein